MPEIGRSRRRSTTGDMGFLHSFTTGSAVDGPGVRVVAWTAGCQLRCRYCHNPDTWNMTNGMPVPLARAVEELRKYRHGLQGDVRRLHVQRRRAADAGPVRLKLFAAAKAMGIHTALDTNGYLGERLSDAELGADRSGAARHQDHGIPSGISRLTGKDIGPTLEFARRLAAAQAADLGSLRAGARLDRRHGGRRARSRRFAGETRQRRAGGRAAVPSDGPLQVGASSGSTTRSTTSSLRRRSSSSACVICFARQD